jgi:hypothetical protein
MAFVLNVKNGGWAQNAVLGDMGTEMHLLLSCAACVADAGTNLMPEMSRTTFCTRWSSGRMRSYHPNAHHDLLTCVTGSSLMCSCVLP